MEPNIVSFFPWHHVGIERTARLASGFETRSRTVPLRFLTPLLLTAAS